MRPRAPALRRTLQVAALLLTACHATAAAQLPLDTLSLGALRIVSWPGTRTLAAALAAATREAPALPGMPAVLLERGDPIVVYITPDERTFRERTGGLAPEWGAGVAFPGENVIVLPGYGSSRGGPQDLDAVLHHELAHVALQRRLPGVRVPRWFTEGYATWSARRLDEDAAWLLRLAFILNRAPELDSLELAWHGGVTDARVAYLLSATAVQHLYGLGTAETFDRFLTAWAESGSFERALRATYRLTSAQFERLWRRAVKRQYGWLLFVTQGVVLGLFFTVLALILFFVRRRRDRRKLARLQATELPDDPAYWLEPPEETGRSLDPPPAPPRD